MNLMLPKQTSVVAKLNRLCHLGWHFNHSTHLNVDFRHGVTMKKIMTGITFAALFLINTGASAALQTGTWNINGNGSEGSFIIESVGPDGSVAGQVFGNSFQGFWDETSQRIMFMRVSPSGSSYIQIYTGYLFYTPRTGKYTLTGNFEAFEGTGGTSSRNVFGWYAEVLRAPD